MAEGGVGKSARYLVTGASGFVASKLIQDLLNSGHSVVGSVRDPSNEAKVGYLRSFAGSERLHLVKADLLEAGSFDEAVKGCDGVFHVASPFFFGDKEEDLIPPALEGTLNVLRSAAKEESVRRVVLTSSVAAVNSGGAPADPSVGYSGSDWADEAVLREKGSWYPLSKTLAERAAWRFVEETKPGFDLVAMNPVGVFGTFLQPSLCTIGSLVRHMMAGTMPIPEAGYVSVVDVADVSEAHIKAMLAPAGQVAGKRFILVGQVMPYPKVGEAVRNALPEELRAAVRTAPTEHPDPENKYDTTPAREILGISFKAGADSVQDSVRSILASKHWPLEK